ncbi:MAG: glucosamine-6-phosphate isomerase [Bacteroidota bacterium]
MEPSPFTPVEEAFFKESGMTFASAPIPHPHSPFPAPRSPFPAPYSPIPYLVTEHFPKLGLLTALRFLEWVNENQEGVISLPTGKTPEFFIKWTQYLLSNWEDKKVRDIVTKHSLKTSPKPSLQGLSFIQIDEFYPIDPAQHNSFFNYVNTFYVGGLGLDRKRCLLINCDEIELADGKSYKEIFPDMNIDLSLRYRDCSSRTDRLKKDSIFMIDEWCAAYEEKIRKMGGIGFFLGGIGPDGHIAFNTRGTDHHSTTRLTYTNFETQAVAAADLGGISASRNRPVITIGLETITYNPDCTAIIIAAGDAKARVVANALENEPSNLYPASALGKLKNSRFYLTSGAATKLRDSINKYYFDGPWNEAKSQRAVTELCKRINKFGPKLEAGDLLNDTYCKDIPGDPLQNVLGVIEAMKNKIVNGTKKYKNEVFLHTGPHHDDIMLGIMPQVARMLREPTNRQSFAIMTSGFTAVTNTFITETLYETLRFIRLDKIQMIHYPDFFTEGYKLKWDKDVYHYLNNVALNDTFECRRALCHRLVRAVNVIFGIRDTGHLKATIENVIREMNTFYDGQKNPPEIQKLKGMLREFEEELVWAHFGVQVKDVHHLRLGFYTGDIFTEQPERARDVEPILGLLRSLKPSIISLALDPEGSGPDTHYKVMQAIAQALRILKAEKDISGLRIWGYRNVWYRFHPGEVNMFIPVSLNAISLLSSAFSNCYISQVNAEFPSFELDGKFSDLATRIWVEQLKEVQLVLGKDYFYQNPLPLLRSTHGIIYLKEMQVEEFLTYARKLETITEG